MRILCGRDDEDMLDRESKDILSESAKGVHEKVIELLQFEKPGRLLDAGSGYGLLSKRIQDIGFEIFAADLDNEKFKVATIKCQKVDLNKGLPYQDNFFDYVICLETIEHLENPYHLVREFFRILKKEGKLIISTPNILNIHARLRYLLRGSADWLHVEINRNVYERLRRHINLIGFIELKYILENNGFNIESVSVNQSVLLYTGGKLFLKPLVACLLFACANVVRLMAFLIRRDDPLRQQLLSNKLLFGEELILKAKKV